VMPRWTHYAKITSLRDLNLSFTTVSDRGLQRLAPLVRLRRLGLSGVKATGSGFEALRTGAI
jgi:hypothetical protein